MPTYDYVCDSCEHKFDAFESIKSEPQKKCPECGKRKLRRLFGIGAGVIFKGSGFYQTDYRSEGYKKKAEAEKSSESKSNESASTKSEAESKTESKAETKSTQPEMKSTETNSSNGIASKSAAKRKSKK